MKYEFIKNAPDDYTLKYKDKVINFHNTVDIATKLQSSIEKGKNKLIFDLAKEGLTIKSLEVETKKDGKTYIDNSNFEALEKNYIEKAQADTFIEIVEELFKTNFNELMKDIGFSTESEMTQFGTDLGNILNGNFPSK